MKEARQVFRKSVAQWRHAEEGAFKYLEPRDGGHVFVLFLAKIGLSKHGKLTNDAYAWLAAEVRVLT